MKINAEIEPVYILGDFSVNPVEKGWEIDETSHNLFFRKLEDTRFAVLLMGCYLQ